MFSKSGTISSSPAKSWEEGSEIGISTINTNTGVLVSIHGSHLRAPHHIQPHHLRFPLLLPRISCLGWLSSCPFGYPHLHHLRHTRLDLCYRHQHAAAAAPLACQALEGLSPLKLGRLCILGSSRQVTLEQFPMLKVNLLFVGLDMNQNNNPDLLICMGQPKMSIIAQLSQ